MVFMNLILIMLDGVEQTQLIVMLLLNRNTVVDVIIVVAYVTQVLFLKTNHVGLANSINYNKDIIL